MILVDQLYALNFVDLKQGVKLCNNWGILINEYHLGKQFKDLQYKFGKGNAIRIRNKDLVNFIVYASPVLSKKPNVEYTNTETKLGNPTFDYTDTVKNQTGLVILNRLRPAQKVALKESFHHFFTNFSNQGMVQPNRVPLLSLILDYFDSLYQEDNQVNKDLPILKAKALSLLNQLNHHYDYEVTKGNSPLNVVDLPSKDKLIPTASSSISKFMQSYRATLLGYGYEVKLTDISASSKSITEIEVKATENISNIETTLFSLNELAMMFQLSVTFIAEEVRAGNLHNSVEDGGYGFLLEDINNYTELRYVRYPCKSREFNFNYQVKNQSNITVDPVADVPKEILVDPSTTIDPSNKIVKLRFPGIHTDPIRKEKPCSTDPEISEFTFFSTASDQVRLDTSEELTTSNDNLVADRKYGTSIIESLREEVSRPVSESLPTLQDLINNRKKELDTAIVASEESIKEFGDNLDRLKSESNQILGDLLPPELYENISSYPYEDKGRLATFDETVKELKVSPVYLRKLLFENPQCMKVEGYKLDIYIDELRPYCELIRLKEVTDILQSLAKDFEDNYLSVSKRRNSLSYSESIFNAPVEDLFELLGLKIDPVHFNKGQLISFLQIFLCKLNGPNEVQAVDPEAPEEVSG